MSYGDPTDNAMGRAQVPGPSDGSGDDYDYAPPSAPTGRASVPPVTGRASVGSASVGSASVPGSEPDYGPRDYGPRDYGYDDGGGFGGGYGPTTGRAPVTGRASVRGSVPVGPGIGPEPDILTGGGPPGVRPPRESKLGAGKGRRNRRRNIIIAAIAAAIMLLGVGMVGGTYYVEGVELPADAKLYESTTIFYADGVLPMAKIGLENRTVIPFDKMPKQVKEAVVATEDMNFYKHDGIDYRGIARAAWNNFTGGELQGASTINQQLARNVAKLKGVTYGRKLREAVIASKLNQQLSKDEILERYLNTVYFGRHAYGVEAAAQAYFAKPSEQLSVAEAMVLMGVIKDPAGPDGKGGPYDPTRSPETEKTAKDRFFNYIRPNMVKMGYLSQADADALKYPETVVKVDPKTGGDSRLRAQWGLDKPEGLIVHQVLSELSKQKTLDGKPRFSPDEIKTGGLQIKTTLDQKKQAAANMYASGLTKDSPMFGQNPDFRAALVAVEPNTGRVRAYYGGPEGDGSDYAHWFADPVLSSGKPEGFGLHPPASSFKVYTLAAALEYGRYSLDSHWDGSSPKDFPDSGRTSRSQAGQVKNNDGQDARCETWCSLVEATASSLNTPYFAVGEEVGWDRVAQAASQAGVRSIRDLDGTRQDITNKKAADLKKLKLSTEIAIGQYGISVLDHANGLATFAADGNYAEAHFVMEVWKGGEQIYKEKLGSTRRFSQATARNISYALSQVEAARGDGISTAGKTGTWQSGPDPRKPTGNAHTWMVGYVLPGGGKNANSPGLATAVWVGNKKDELPMTLKNGSRVYGSTLAAPTFRRFMSAATKGTRPGALPDRMIPTGEKDVGNGIEPDRRDRDDRRGRRDGPGPGNGFPFPVPTNTRPGNGGGGGRP
jgi:membrane peptidoglycan carboxypeptidase